MINQSQSECPNNSIKILRHENTILKQEKEEFKKDNIELRNQIEKIDSEYNRLKSLQLAFFVCIKCLLNSILLLQLHVILKNFWIWEFSYLIPSVRLFGQIIHY